MAVVVAVATGVSVVVVVVDADGVGCCGCSGRGRGGGKSDVVSPLSEPLARVNSELSAGLVMLDMPLSKLSCCCCCCCSFWCWSDCACCLCCVEYLFEARRRVVSRVEALADVEVVASFSCVCSVSASRLSGATLLRFGLVDLLLLLLLLRPVLVDLSALATAAVSAPPPASALLTVLRLDFFSASDVFSARRRLSLVLLLLAPVAVARGCLLERAVCFSQ